MMRLLCATFAAILLTGAGMLPAAEPVIGSTDPDALFHSGDPKLNAHKQTVYHIIKDIIEAGHWELADQYMTADYIQHNPKVPTGRGAAEKYFTQVLKIKPKPILPRLQTIKVVAVIAEGNYVIVAEPRELPDPHAATGQYTTTWFDMWRFDGDKVAEHWDAAKLDDQFKL
jgi:predicted SnoaL-like aldol condensation-catalyzing enzyme